MGRTIIIGDVHGCRGGGEALLSLLDFRSGARLVFVGDVVARGPDSLGVLDILRRTGAVLVRGNHEDKLVDSHEADPHPLVWQPGPAPKNRPPSSERSLGRGPKPPKKPLGRFHAEVADKLRPADWALLE